MIIIEPPYQHGGRLVSTLCEAIIAKQTRSPITVDGGVLEDDRGGRRTWPHCRR